MLANDLEADEERLRDKNKRMLAATGALYGTDSNEYEVVSGTRASDRKPKTRKQPNNT